MFRLTYEWLTGRASEVPECLAGNYVDAINDAKLIAASPDRVVRVPRWRVRDNLPDTRWFSARRSEKTAALIRAADPSVPRLFRELTAELGEDLLLRAAIWTTLRESNRKGAKDKWHLLKLRSSPDRVRGRL